MSFGKLYDADDLDYMPEVEAATRRRGHRFAYMLTIMSVLFFACFLVWAYYAVLDEVTRGEATITNRCPNSSRPAAVRIVSVRVQKLLRGSLNSQGAPAASPINEPTSMPSTRSSRD